MIIPRICLLGKFQIQGENRVVSCFKSRKVQELFCYLLLFREHPQQREGLASIFWGDYSTESSKKYLRQSLWMLQSSLSEIMGSVPPPLLRIEAEWVQVNPQSVYWLDIASFESAYQTVKDIPVQNLTDQDITMLAEAVDLYRGDLMDGCYQDWCLYERARLQEIYQSLLNTLAYHYELHQEYENGLDYARRMLNCDYANERTHRQLMRLYYFSGNRTQALRQFKTCEEALRTELDVQPSQKTILLYEQMRADTLPPPMIVPSREDAPGTMTPGMLADSLERMQHLQEMLRQMQSQLQSEILALEKALEVS